MESIALPRRVLVGMSCLLAATTVGCRSTQFRSSNNGPKPTPPAQATQATGKPDPTRTAKTDFQAKVTKDQAFNTHLAMGKNFTRQGNYDLAIAEFQKALDSNVRGRGHGKSQSKAEAHRQMAKAYDHLGKFVQSEEQYRLAEKLAPHDPKVWNDWGYSYHIQGRFADAERCLRTALKFDKQQSPGIYNNLGLTLAAAGKTDEALENLSRVGGPAAGHANLGYILASLGRTDDAKLHYRKALEIQPGHAIFKAALAQLDLPPLPSIPPGTVAELTPRPKPSVDAGIQRVSATAIQTQTKAAAPKAPAKPKTPAAPADRTLILPTK